MTNRHRIPYFRFACRGFETDLKSSQLREEASYNHVLFTDGYYVFITDDRTEMTTFEWGVLSNVTGNIVRREAHYLGPFREIISENGWLILFPSYRSFDPGGVVYHFVKQREGAKFGFYVKKYVTGPMMKSPSRVLIFSVACGSPWIQFVWQHCTIHPAFLATLCHTFILTGNTELYMKLDWQHFVKYSACLSTLHYTFSFSGNTVPYFYLAWQHWVFHPALLTTLHLTELYIKLAWQHFVNIQLDWQHWTIHPVCLATLGHTSSLIGNTAPYIQLDWQHWALHSACLTTLHHTSSSTGNTAPAHNKWIQ